MTGENSECFKGQDALYKIIIQNNINNTFFIDNNDDK